MNVCTSINGGLPPVRHFSFIPNLTCHLRQRPASSDNRAETGRFAMVDLFSSWSPIQAGVCYLISRSDGCTNIGLFSLRLYAIEGTAFLLPRLFWTLPRSSASNDCCTGCSGLLSDFPSHLPFPRRSTAKTMRSASRMFVAVVHAQSPGISPYVRRKTACVSDENAQSAIPMHRIYTASRSNPQFV